MTFTLFDKELEYYTKYAVEFKQHCVPKEEFCDALYFLWHYFDHSKGGVSSEIYNVYVMMSKVVGFEFNREDNEYEGVTYNGKLLTRIEKAISMFGNEPLNDADKQTLADLIADYKVYNVENLFIEFANKIDWSPGDFCEYENSCWWDGWSEGKSSFEWMMKQGKAAAIRLYNGKTPIGRCFIVVNSANDIILFNFYGNGIADKDFILCLKHWFDVKTKSITLKLNTSIYINGERGTRFYTTDKMLPAVFTRRSWSDYNFDDYDIEYSRLRLDFGTDEIATCEQCKLPRFYEHVRNVAPHKEDMCTTCWSARPVRLQSGWLKNGRHGYFDIRYFTMSYDVTKYRTIATPRDDISDEMKQEIIEFESWYEKQCLPEI